MQLIKKPVTGMKDILPQEMAIREYVLDKYSDIFEGMEIVKLIIVPKRIVNAVIRPKK